MGFVRRLGTTGKVSIPDSLKKELEDNDIPPPLVLNLDETLSKYIPVLNKTIAPKGSKTVPIQESTEKRMVTASFAITLNGHFLPVQLIYG